MTPYIPTPGPLPGEQWKPSNADAGYGFLSDVCGSGARDKSVSEGKNIDDCTADEICPIIGASFAGEAVEWREMPDGEVICTHFTPAGEPIPKPRCENTADMFAPSNQEREAEGEKLKHD